MNFMEKYCISVGRKGSSWVSSFQEVLRSHDLQSRCADATGTACHCYTAPLKRATFGTPLGPRLPTNKDKLPGTLIMPAVWCRGRAWLLRGGNLWRRWQGLDFKGWGGPGCRGGGSIIKGEEAAVLCVELVFLFDLSGKWQLRLGISAWASSEISVSFLLMFYNFERRGSS